MRKKLLFGLLAHLIGTAAMAQGVIIIDLPKRGPHPLPRTVLEIRSLHVETRIEGPTALTEMEQVFYNPGGRMEEGTFLFPLPKGATIESFSMFINGVETRAELLDAGKAARIYNDIVRSMRDPALLEYAGNDLFKARIFPIEARSEKKIRLRYREVLQRDGGLARYGFPLRSGRLGRTGTWNDGQAQAAASFSMRVTVALDQPIKTLYSPTHAFDIRRKNEREAVLSYESEKPERDIEILISSGRDPIGMDLLTYESEGERYFWLTLVPDLSREKVVARDIIFLLDTSGSMNGEKIEQAKNALRFCVAHLNRDDRFEIIRFATEAEALAGALLPVGKASLDRAGAFIDEIDAIGGTNLDDALSLAQKLPVARDRPQLIVLLTDGKPTIGECGEDSLVTRMRAAGGDNKRVFTFGIGYDINTHLLDRIAEESRGWRTYAAPEEDLELKLSSFWQKIGSPVLADLRLDAGKIRLGERYPKQLPDLFAGTPLHLFGTFKGEGDTDIHLRGTVNGEEKTYRYRASFTSGGKGQAFIAELWAKRRVGYLLDEIRLHGEDKELVAEVVRLAKKHGIITPYTSYLILEDTPLAVRDRAPGPRLQDELRRDSRFFREESEGLAAKSGEASVRASRAVHELAQVENAVAPGGTLAAQAPSVHVAGRAFYLLDGIWQDAALDGAKGAPVEKLALASEAYFNLLTRHPEIGPILALGSQVRFLLEGTIYEVTLP